MKTIKLLIIFTGIALLASRCSKDFLDVSDPNNIDRSVFWTSEENAVKSVNAIYSSMKEPEFLGYDYFLFAPFISGEYDRPYPGDQARLDILNFSIKSDNKINNLMWKDIFRSIMRCNDAIANIPRMADDDVSIEKKNQLLGQAYFLRGFIELYELQMYGKYYPAKDTNALGIPLVLKVPQSREDMFVKRATVGASYRQIVADFAKGSNLLPATWDAANTGRATKGAAIAYAAKAYMWVNEYDKAIAAFDALFAMARYSLIEKYENNTNGLEENNSESIFELQYADVTTLNPWMGGSAQGIALEFAPLPIGRGNAGISTATSDAFALSYTITADYMNNAETQVLPADMLAYLGTLLGKTISPADLKSNLIANFGQDMYDANITALYKWIEGAWDPRWLYTAFQPGDSVKPDKKWEAYAFKTQVYTPKKYIKNDRVAINNGGTFGANTDNIQLYRLSYAYLLYAEAQNEKGNTAKAIEYVNKVRSRAYKNFPELMVELKPGLSKDQIQAEIDTENLREFCGECVRWFDMVRWGATEKYCARRGFIKGVNEVLPIPLEELDLNPNMQQNEGF